MADGSIEDVSCPEQAVESIIQNLPHIDVVRRSISTTLSSVLESVTGSRAVDVDEYTWKAKLAR